MKGWMKQGALALGLVTGSALAAHAGSVNTNGRALVPSGKGYGVLAEPDQASESADAIDRALAAKIRYHGGPVMTASQNKIYYIWYGNWSGNTAQSILDNFAQRIGGSPYFNINTTYYSGSTTKTYVKNNVAQGTSYFDNYSQGTALSDAQIKAVVTAVNPTDTNAVYFVLTSADVNATSGFCTQYCGWHNHATIGGKDIKYSFVGNPDRCLSSCTDGSASPNGNRGADGMASIVAHEFEEAVTDPDLNAWYFLNGMENADKCAWTFGTTYTTGNGGKANMKLGSLDYLIQQNWKNTATGAACTTHYP